MSGIVFFGSERLEQVVQFYQNSVAADIWLEQPDCTILQFDNMLFGFCERAESETTGTITFVVDDRQRVDAMYEQFGSDARGEPKKNERYDIYQFFADDPEGRTVEVQTFLHPTDPI